MTMYIIKLLNTDSDLTFFTVELQSRDEEHVTQLKCSSRGRVTEKLKKQFTSLKILFQTPLQIISEI